MSAEETSYLNWSAAALRRTYHPISSDRLAEMYTATCKYGSGNCWTGTSGTLASMVRELLREVEHLRAER